MGDRDATLEDRLNAVRAYLQHEFPERSVLGPAADPKRDIYAFTLPGNPPYFISVSAEFLEDHTASEITGLLRERAIGGLLGSMPGRRVIVTRAGMGFEPA